MRNRLTSRPEQRAARAERVLHAARAVAGLLSSATAPSDLLDGFLELLMPPFELATAAVFALDAERPWLRLLSSRGWPASVVVRLARVGLDAPLLAARAAAVQQHQLVNDTARLADELALTREVVVDRHLNAVLAVPLIAQQRLLGVAEFGRAGGEPFDEDEVDLIRSFVGLLACGLDHAWDHQAAQDRQAVLHELNKRVKELSVLHRAARLLQQEALTVDEVLRAFVAIVRAAWQFPDLAEVRVVTNGREVATPRFTETPWKQQAELALPDGHVGRLEVVYREDKPFLAEEASLVGSLAEMLAGYLGRQYAVEALRQSEQRFRRLVENAGDLIYRYELWPTRRFSYVSPSSTRLLGYTPEELYADPDLKLKVVHPDDKHVVEAMLEGGIVPPSLVLRWRHKDGYFVWIEDHNVPIYDAGGRLVAIEGIARDVTERRRVEEERALALERERAAREAAEAEQARLATILASAPHAFFFVDATTGFVTANPKAVQLFGRSFTPEAGPAQYVGQVCRPDGRPLTLEELPSSLALKGRPVQDQEGLIIRPDGRRVPVLLSAAPVVGRRGEIMGAVVTIQDISVLKELERLREEWTSVIAHDLRQPVAVISGYAGLLRRLMDRGVVDAQSKQAAEHILASARQLSRMIGDLLDASRLEAGRLQLERQPIDLPELVRTVLDRMAEVIDGHPVRVEVKNEIPRLLADPGRIEQVVSNLVSNAAKYSDPGTEIWLRLERREQEVLVAVTNRGPGIQPEDLPGLFTRFHRARRARAEERAGLGLGLYITQGLVRAHGGRVWAESVPGELTTFYFTLPIHPPTGPEAPGQAR